MHLWFLVIRNIKVDFKIVKPLVAWQIWLTSDIKNCQFRSANTVGLHDGHFMFDGNHKMQSLDHLLYRLCLWKQWVIPDLCWNIFTWLMLQYIFHFWKVILKCNFSYAFLPMWSRARIVIAIPVPGFHRSVAVSCRWVKASACSFQICRFCGPLCQMVSFVTVSPPKDTELQSLMLKARFLHLI